MFELCSIAAFDVTKGRIRLNDPFFAQILQGHQITFFAQPIQPPPTKGQSAEMLIDGVQQLFGSEIASARLWSKKANAVKDFKLNGVKQKLL